MVIEARVRRRAAHGCSVAALAFIAACVEDLRFFVDAGHSTPDATARPADGAAPQDTPSCNVDLSALLPPTAATREKLFRYALCSCADIKLPLPLTTDAFDSRVGPYAPGTRGGSVGTNRRLSAASTVDIGGSIVASGHGSAAVFVGASSRVSDYVRLNTELSINSAELRIERDLWVNGRILSVNGALHVGGQISQPDAADNLGDIAAAEGLHVEPVRVDQACACDGLDFTHVTEHFAAHSDNAAQHLQPDALAAAPQLAWPCGQFTFTGGSIAATRWSVSDRTALFIEGDLDLGAPLEISLGAQAGLDIFVHGSLHLKEAAALSTTRPGQLRVYVSGTDPILLPYGARFDCSLYAPNAELRVRDQSELSGAFLVSELVTSTALAIHYDASAANGFSTSCTADGDCTPPWICEAGECVATH